ncbi:MAG: hypothetical protein IAE93_13465 [Ignavibacteria bacterium]|nr:hypothetical protein [Ignavibacteria bacterium]
MENDRYIQLLKWAKDNEKGVTWNDLTAVVGSMTALEVSSLVSKFTDVSSEI